MVLLRPIVLTTSLLLVAQAGDAPAGRIARVEEQLEDGPGGVWKYYAVFGSLVAAGLGMPIPEELPVVAGGVAAGHAASQGLGHPYWWIMLPVCYAGVLISDIFLYVIGRFGGRRILHIPWVQHRVITPEKQREIESNFHKYGVKILLGARFLPGIRAPIFFMSGVMHMPIVKFLIADGIYAIPGVSTLFGLSYWFTDSFLTLFQHFHDKVYALQKLLVLLVIAAVGGYFFYAYKRRSVATGDPHEVPLLGSKVTDPPIQERSESPADVPPV